MPTVIHRPTEFDPMNGPGAPDEHWSTDNVGEAMPGVLSPLGASVWDSVANHMLGRVAHGLGVFSAAERDSAHRYFRLFYGRGALQVEPASLPVHRREAAAGVLRSAAADPTGRAGDRHLVASADRDT